MSRGRCPSRTSLCFHRYIQGRARASALAVFAFFFFPILATNSSKNSPGESGVMIISRKMPPRFLMRTSRVGILLGIMSGMDSQPATPCVSDGPCVLPSIASVNVMFLASQISSSLARYRQIRPKSLTLKAVSVTRYWITSRQSTLYQKTSAHAATPTAIIQTKRAFIFQCFRGCPAQW